MIEIYLAGPYTHADPAVCQWRYERLTEGAALLVSRGIKPIYSPITHSHPIAACPTARSLAYDHGVWMGFDLPFLAGSKALWVLMLPGWADSKGIAAETKFALDNGIPVSYMEPVYDAMFRLVDMEEV
jgi:hypothetical protein